MRGQQKESESAQKELVCKMEVRVYSLAGITIKVRNSVNYTLHHNYHCTAQLCLAVKPRTIIPLLRNPIRRG